MPSWGNVEMMFKKVLWLFLLTTVASSSVWAGRVRFSLVGTADYNTYNENGAKGELGFGAGGLLEFRFGTKVSLETGMIYTRRVVGFEGMKYYSNLGDIPVVLRFALGRVFSIGLGGFYELPFESGAVGYYGATADMRLAIPMGASTAFILQPRYSYDLKNTAPGQVHFISGIAGFRFGM
jgi:hypothetical protein